MDNFQEFLTECREQLVNSNAKGLVKLISKRYSEADPSYLQSEDFTNLLNNIRQSIVTDSKRFFVHLKDFLQALKDKKDASGNSCSGDERQPPRKRARVQDSDDCSGAESGETSRARATLFEDSELGSSLSESESENGRKGRIDNIIQGLYTDQDKRKTDLAGVNHGETDLTGDLDICESSDTAKKKHSSSDQSGDSSDSSLPAFDCYSSSVREIHDETLEDCNESTNNKVDIQTGYEIEDECNDNSYTGEAVQDADEIEEEECNETSYTNEVVQDADEIEEEEVGILEATKLYPEDTGDEFGKSDCDNVDYEEEDNVEDVNDGIVDIKETELANQEKVPVNDEQSEEEMNKDVSDEGSNSEASEDEDNKISKNRNNIHVSRVTDTDCEERKKLQQNKAVSSSGSEGEDYCGKKTEVKKRKREVCSSSNEDSTDSEENRRIREKCRKKYAISVGKRSAKSHSPSRSGHSSGTEKHSNFSGSKLKHSQKKKSPWKKSPGRMSPKNKKDVPLVIITDSESSSECDLSKETFNKKLDEKYGKNYTPPSEQISRKKKLKKNEDKKNHVKNILKEKFKDSDQDNSTDDNHLRTNKRKYDTESETDNHSRTNKRKYDTESEPETSKRRISLVPASDQERQDTSVKVKHHRDSPKATSSVGPGGEGGTGNQPGPRDEVTVRAGPSSGSDNSRAKPDTNGAAEKKKGSSRQIKRLEDLLQQISKRIEEIRRRELSLDDLDSDVSDYLLEDRLQRKFMKVWEKLCELNKAATITGRHTEKYFRYQGTRYPDINRKIEKYINRKKVFPDYQDIRTIIVAVNKSKGLHLRPRDMCDLAREAFTEVGNKLQRRRQKDVASTYKTDEILDVDDDIPFSDPELRRKLDANRKEGKTKMDEICEKYVHLQMSEGDRLDDDDDSNEEEQDEDEEVGNRMEELEIDAAITRTMVDNSDTESPCLEIENIENGDMIAIDLEEPMDIERLQKFKGTKTGAKNETEEESFAAMLGLKSLEHKQADIEKDEIVKKENIDAHAKSEHKESTTHVEPITIDLDENEIDIKDIKKTDSRTSVYSGGLAQGQLAGKVNKENIEVCVKSKPKEINTHPDTITIDLDENEIEVKDEKCTKTEDTCSSKYSQKQPAVKETDDDDVIIIDDTSSVLQKMAANSSGSKPVWQTETLKIKDLVKEIKSNNFKNICKMKPVDTASKITTGTRLIGNNSVIEEAGIEVVCLDDVSASNTAVQQTGLTKTHKETVQRKGADLVKRTDINNFKTTKSKPNETKSKPAANIAVNSPKSSTGKSDTVIEESGIEVVCLDDDSSSQPVVQEISVMKVQKETGQTQRADSVKGTVSRSFKITSKMKPDEKTSKPDATIAVNSSKSVTGTNVEGKFDPVKSVTDEASSIEVVCLEDELSEGSESEESDILIPLITEKQPPADDVTAESEPEYCVEYDDEEIPADTADKFNEVFGAISDTDKVESQPEYCVAYDDDEEIPADTADKNNEVFGAFSDTGKEESEPEYCVANDDDEEFPADTDEQVSEAFGATSKTSKAGTITEDVSCNKLSDAQTLNSVNPKKDDLGSTSEFHEKNIAKNKHSSKLDNSSTQGTDKTTEVNRCKALDTKSGSGTSKEGELETKNTEPSSDNEDMEKLFEHQLSVNTCVSSISDIFQDDTPGYSPASANSLEEADEIDDIENVEEEKCETSAATNNTNDANSDCSSSHSSPLHCNVEENLEDTSAVEIESNKDTVDEDYENSDPDLTITSASNVVSSQISRVTEKLKHPSVKDKLIKLERASHLIVYPIVNHRPKTKALELEVDEHANLIETYIEPDSTVISDSHAEDVIVLSDSE